jgi:hypothetical protein
MRRLFRLSSSHFISRFPEIVDLPICSAPLRILQICIDMRRYAILEEASNVAICGTGQNRTSPRLATIFDAGRQRGRGSAERAALLQLNSELFNALRHALPQARAAKDRRIKTVNQLGNCVQAQTDDGSAPSSDGADEQK